MSLSMTYGALVLPFERAVPREQAREGWQYSRVLI